MRKCAYCSTDNLEDALVCTFCGRDLGPILEPVAVPTVTSGVYASFWDRFGAFILDAIIMGIVGGIIGGIIGFIWGMVFGDDAVSLLTLRCITYIVVFGLGVLYYAGFESSAKQATLGKMVVGIIVTDMNGQRIDFGRAAGRYLGKILSGLILGIGYLMVIGDDQKQGLHDQLAGTLVYKK